MKEKIPQLYALFVFLLIISGNFIAELLPCRIQSLLNSNMIFKHFFGFLTLIFFVVLSSNDNNKKNIYSKSIILYILFLLLINTNYKFFTIIVVLLGITYLLNIHKIEFLDRYVALDLIFK